MSKHRREVARKMKDEKERQLEPIQRLTAVRQRAAEQEIVQAMFRPAHAKVVEVAYHLLRSHSVHAQHEHHPQTRLAACSCQKTCHWHNNSAASIHNVWSTVKAAPAKPQQDAFAFAFPLRMGCCRQGQRAHHHYGMNCGLIGRVLLLNPPKAR